MDIPWDPPLVLHMSASWWLASLPVLSSHQYTVAEVRFPGFKLMLSECLWVRRYTNWAKPGPTYQKPVTSFWNGGLWEISFLGNSSSCFYISKKSIYLKNCNNDESRTKSKFSLDAQGWQRYRQIFNRAPHAHIYFSVITVYLGEIYIYSMVLIIIAFL